MGELVGIPEWLAATLFVLLFICVVGVVAWRNSSRQVNSTLARRANPDQEEFLALMSPHVSTEASEFLWHAALPYLEGKPWNLTPHPDDSLVDDLPIADEDWSMEWPLEWAAERGFHESNRPDWPDDWPPTIRNYGRWLDLGPES